MPRRTDYDPAFVDLARNYCKLGAIDVQLAAFFNCSRSTLNEWMLRYPEFAEAIEDGKAFADGNVVRSLYHRANGYSHKAQKVFQHQGKPVIVEYTEHYPPDVMACMYWLNNRARDQWKTRQNVEHSVITENFARAVELGQFTDDELEQISAGKITRDLLGRISAAAARAPTDTGAGGA